MQIKFDLSKLDQPEQNTTDNKPLREMIANLGPGLAYDAKSIPADKQNKALKFVAQEAVALPDVAGAVASDLFTAPFSITAGLAALPWGADAANIASQVVSNLGYKPHTKYGKQAYNLMKKGMEYYLMPSTMAAKEVSKYSPRAAHLVNLGGQLMQFGLLGGLGKMAMPKGAPDLTPRAIKEMTPEEVAATKEHLLNNMPDELKNAIAEKTKTEAQPTLNAQEGVSDVPLKEKGVEQPKAGAKPAEGKIKQPWEMKKDEFYNRNIETYPGVNLIEQGRKIDNLPDDAKIWVYHATYPKTAKLFKEKGIIQAEKPLNATRVKYEKGQPAEFAPGRGAAPGLTVGATPQGVSGYGPQILAIHIPKSKLSISPEAARLGNKTPGEALSVDDAYIKGNVPKEDVFILGQRGIYPRSAHMEFVKQALKEGKPVPKEVLAEYPDLVKPEAKPAEGKIETREAYKKTSSETKNLKDLAVKAGQSFVDTFDVKAPFIRRGAPKTGTAFQNMFSKMAAEGERGLHQARENAKLFGFDKKVAPDVVLSAEDPQYFKNLPQDIKAKVEPAAKDLTNYFKEGQKEYARRGVKIDFKQRILADIDDTIEKLEDSKNKTDEIRKQIQDLKTTRKIAARMKFVHIPSAIWFEDFIGKDPAGAAKSLKLAITQQRKSLTIQSLIDRGLINKEDIHPADIIASYARRKGKDFALLDFVDAAKKEGLASLKEEPGMVKIPNYIAPVLSKYWVKKPLADMIYDMSRLGRMSKFEKVLAATKMMQFYNPLFLPMYDMVQQAMLVGPKMYKMPKYWALGIKDVWDKTPEYFRAMDYGLASKPFNAPWNEFKESLELAKKSNPEIAKALTSDIFSPKALKLVYHSSWNIAWALDKTIRMTSYRYLLGHGYAPEEAARIAAEFHGDYASVPMKTRKALNKVLFTPTFKIIMGKLYGRMIKNAIKGVVKGGKIDMTSAAYAKGAAYTFGILEGFDMFMTKGLGFKRDEWGRRYIKPNVGTKEGKKELVVTWSSPANLAFKYIYRGKQALKRGELTQKVRSFIEMNKWEFHPIWRTLYDEFWTNKTPSGDEIVNPFDPPETKAIKRTKYFAKSMVAVVGLLDRDKMNKAAKKQFAKETSRAFEFITRPFIFKYMRNPKNQQLYYQFKRTKKTFYKELYKGNITPKRTKMFQKEISNILEQMQKK